jgi:single-stranded-DNA-specific exonuclease
MTLKPLEEITEKIEEELGSYSPVLRRLLVNRGLVTREDAFRFLNPSYDEDVHDPFLMQDMERAIERIHRAVQSGEKIAVYADYDCDGIPGAVIMTDFFEMLGYENFEVYIPDRHKEGYGLQIPALDMLMQKKTSLVVTVDLGITNHKEVEHCNKHGVDIIVTDHHLVHETIPDAYAVVNPKREDCVYPDPMLCGSGVAFKLVQAFLKQYGDVYGVIPGTEKWMLDMVGLATLSDMVPLRHENRVLAHYGLKVFKKTRRTGLLHLLKKARVRLDVLLEDDVTFMVTPRINAAGRMDHPKRAYELLVAKESEKSFESAKLLHDLNNTRKKLVMQIMKKAKSVLSKRTVKDVIVVGDREWSIGVLGLVASKLVEEYGVSVFVWGSDEDSSLLKGSCRSDESVSLVELMSQSANLFENFGGHEGAGGFSISAQNIHFLEESLNTAYPHVAKEKKEERVFEYDTELRLSDVTTSLYFEVQKLAPFGVGNHRPVFLFRDVLVQDVRMFGKANEHLEIMVKDPETNTSLKAISFFTKHNAFAGGSLQNDIAISLFASLEYSTFSYRPELRLRIVNVHFSV